MTFYPQADVVAGAGLTLTGSVMSVNVDGVTIEISGNALRIKDGGVTPAKVSVPLPRNLYRSGLYYGASGPAGGGVLVTNNRQYWSPVWLDVGQGFDRVGINTTVASQAGGTCRLGVYDDNGQGVPNNLLVEWGTVALDAAPGDLVLTISWTVPANGLYWLSALPQTASTTQATCAMTNAGQAGTGRATTSGPGSGYFLNGLAGAMANAGPGVLATGASNIATCIRVALRAA